jgi:ABC-2 type transport system permease protein
VNILNIALKEVKVNVRNIRTFTFMLAFPIVLMLILGTALTNAFHGSATVDDMSLLYNNTSNNSVLTEYWNGFSQGIEKQGVKLTSLPAGVNGLDEIRADHYTAYAEVTDNGIHFYGGTKHTIETNIIQGMLTAFSDRYNLAAAAVKDDPASAKAIVASSGMSAEFIRETALNADKKPGSIDYYAIAMSTMIAMYSAMSASFLIRGERTRNTAARLMASPVSKGEIFAGKVIGCTFINFLCVLIVVLFSKFAFGADWGSHYGSILLVLLTEVLLAVSLGLGVSYLVKDESSRSVIMIFTQIASFLGGAYFPVDDATGFQATLANLSPLRWVNQALTKIIYADNLQAALPAMGLNVGIAAAFLAISIILMRRREAL